MAGNVSKVPLPIEKEEPMGGQKTAEMRRQARRNNQWWLKNLSLIVLAVTALLFISLSL